MAWENPFEIYFSFGVSRLPHIRGVGGAESGVKTLYLLGNLPTEGALMSKVLGTKEQQIMDFLHSRVFDRILHSPLASEKLKAGARLTITRLKERDARAWFNTIGRPSSAQSAARGSPH